MDKDTDTDAPAPGEVFTTGEMARLSDTTLRTVRFYESEGLIQAADREDGSHRKFSTEELMKLQIITDLREAGMSLADIKALVALKNREGTANQAAAKMRAELLGQIARLQERIDTLQRVRLELMNTAMTLEACEHCEVPDFPEGCKRCDLMERRDRSRATHLLWKL